jgi:hypothetical protein
MRLDPASFARVAQRLSFFKTLAASRMKMTGPGFLFVR